MFRSTLASMAESVTKRIKLDGAATTIGTHNGYFHADETLAIYLLRKHIPAYADARLVRTRDADLLATCHTVVDVGGEYDAARYRFDHHQRGFDTVFPGRRTKLSSAGLVYLHFGREMVERKLARHGDGDGADGPAHEENVGLLWHKLYESFVEALDAHDNGISVYDPVAVQAAGLEKRFSDSGFTLGAMVGRLNMNWNDARPEDAAEAQALEDGHFERASQRIGDEFDRELDYLTRAWLPARSLVATAFASKKQYDSEGRIMVMQGQLAPWKDHLYNLEEADPESGRVLYVLYPEKPTPGAKWRIQCVPVSKDSFTSRKPLPEAWRGFRDDELDTKTGIPGCVFVHTTGFIGGNKTYEGAMDMARQALHL